MSVRNRLYRSPSISINILFVFGREQNFVYYVFAWAFFFPVSIHDGDLNCDVLNNDLPQTKALDEFLL